MLGGRDGNIFLVWIGFGGGVLVRVDGFAVVVSWD